MSVTSFRNLNEKYLVLEGRFEIKSGENRFYVTKILVDKESESIYDFSAIDVGEDEIYTDKEGNIYFLGYSNIFNRRSVYKLDVSDVRNIQVEKYLPDGQDVDRFQINTDGICFYGYSGSPNKFKLPSGSIIPISYELDTLYMTHYIFCGLDGQFYVVKEPRIGNPTDQWTRIYIIFRLDFKSNEIIQSEVCSFESFRTSVSLPTQQLNTVRNTICFVTDEGVIEFSSLTGEVTKYSIDGSIYYSDVLGETDTDFILKSPKNGSIVKISKSDYSLQAVELFAPNSHELYEYATDASSPTITFTALRYADGMNVVGTVDANNVVTFKTLEAGKPVQILKVN
jgi:hypothetical protein